MENITRIEESVNIDNITMDVEDVNKEVYTSEVQDDTDRTVRDVESMDPHDEDSTVFTSVEVISLDEFYRHFQR